MKNSDKLPTLQMHKCWKARQQYGNFCLGNNPTVMINS